VGRQIVHDHDVTGPKLGRENLLRIGQEGCTIHRSIEQHRRRQAVQAQAGGEGGRLPVAVGNGRPAALAAWRPAAQASHLCGCCGLIDEDQPRWVRVELAVEPGYAAAQDIRALLLGGVRRLLWNGPPLLRCIG
jgi:hypothetical protein